MSLLLRHLGESFARPDHWLYASWLDLVTKYRRTHLGLFWVWVPPALYIWGIGLFIGAISPVRQRTFVAFVGVSFVVFRLITTVINDSTGTFRSYQAYVNDGQQRLTDYLMRTVARSVFYFIAAVPLLVVALATSEQFTPSGLPMALLGLAFLLVNLVGLATLFALMGARLPDVAELTGSAIMFLFLITPIVWYPASAPEGTLHGTLMRGNPLHHLISVVRDPLLGFPVEPLSWAYVSVMTGLVWVLAVVAYGRFAPRVALWL